MATIVRKTISLPAGLVREIESIARAEGKSLSAVVESSLRQSLAKRRDGRLRRLQGYWSRLARQRGILSERDLDRFLRA